MGQNGIRNVAIIWMLFGSGLRINEVAQLKVRDIFYPSGELKRSVVLPGSYTKTGKARIIYILAPDHRNAVIAWKNQRIQHSAMTYISNSAESLIEKSPLFLSWQRQQWTPFSFIYKKYKTADGVIKTALVCGSMESLVRELLKSAGLTNGSSHSGRRTLASWMDRQGCSLTLIQQILGHESPEMTLEYIDPWQTRIDTAFNELWSGIRIDS